MVSQDILIGLLIGVMLGVVVGATAFVQHCKNTSVTDED